MKRAWRLKIRSLAPGHPALIPQNSKIQKFPEPSTKFPARLIKFPAPSSREFADKQLMLHEFWRRESRLEALFSKNSLLNSLPAGNRALVSSLVGGKGSLLISLLSAGLITPSAGRAGCEEESYATNNQT